MSDCCSVAVAVLVVLAGMACDCPDEPEAEPDVLTERVQADTELCRAALEEWWDCGPTAECRPPLEGDSFALRILFNCAASVCANVDGADPDQCRYDVALLPGTLCGEARTLCTDGADAGVWLPND